MQSTPFLINNCRNVGILHIRGQEFQLEKIPLKSVRPFVMETLVLANIKKFDKMDQAGVERVVTEKVHDLIAKARLKWKGANPTAKPEAFPKPLIRLKVRFRGFHLFLITHFISG